MISTADPAASPNPIAVADFNFELPEELIAQEPAPAREQSRLMVVERASARWQHRAIPAVRELFAAGDLLVVNDTRVIPARLRGHVESGGAAELLLIRRVAQPSADTQRWECLGKPAKRLKVGTRLYFGARLSAVIVGRPEPMRYHVEISGVQDVLPLLEECGELPLPPYIHRPQGPSARDEERYQTVFARRPGAIAAPTAGLHFTPELIDELRQRGVGLESVTLHVGPGTFLPIRCDDFRDHRMEPEWFEVPATTAAAIAATKRAGRRVIAVGTTTTRALESAALGGELTATSGWAELFIVPGFRFRVIDALLTNFHLPASTLLLLVSAFAGDELIRRAYAEAVRERYRFYSYGDAMLIL